MWEWLAKGLCQRDCLEEKTQVWNLQSQREFSTRQKKQKKQEKKDSPAKKIDHEKKQKIPKKKKDTVETQIELDWNRRCRMDSYYEGTTQTVIRQEIYKKILLQQKSPFYTKDLFTISMRNVNERIINERRIIVPERPDDYKSNDSSLEISDFRPAAEMEVQAHIETPPKGEYSDSLVDNSEKESSELKEEMSRSSGSGRSDGGGRGEDLETVVTDVEEDSVGSGSGGVRGRGSGERRTSCTRHEGDTVDMARYRVAETRYDRVLRWMKDTDMPALERSCNGALALHYAAARGCLDCVRLLVDASTDLSANTQMDNDVTPVYLAAQEGHLEVLKFLVLEAGGSLYVRAKDGMAPVHAASQMGCLNCLKWMVQDQGVDPNLRDGDGATPLHFAASRGHVEVVRWLLRHGAKVVTDKYGKSPINDAAENHQMECLNLLVQRGTTPDYHDDLYQGKLHGCTCRAGDSVCSYADCINYTSGKEPFYLHPPGPIKDSPPAKDGLYINPMTLAPPVAPAHNHHGSGFYLHDPQEVPYHRVKDLFNPEPAYSKPPPPPPPPPLTVKVEVHSSSSGAGSDEMSSSDMSERGSGHDYEDIYLVRAEAGAAGARQRSQRSNSRDSGSHSRSNSLSSTHSVVITQQPELPPANINHTPKKQQPEVKSCEEQSQRGSQKTKLNHSHSMPYHHANNRALKRVVSEPGALPPPPPPPPPEELETPPSPRSDSQLSADNVSGEDSSTLRAASPPSEPVNPDKPDPTQPSERVTDAAIPVAVAEPVAVVPTQESSAANANPPPHGPNLVNKQMVLPFIPPKFPSGGDGDEHSLIKPSEYLRALGSRGLSLTPSATSTNNNINGSGSNNATNSSSNKSQDTAPVAVHTPPTEDKTGAAVVGPPPPPLPPTAPPVAAPATRKADQPLGTISIQDLNSVQLRRTSKTLSKTMSAPLTSLTLSGTTESPFQVQKQDLIEELKKSKDITGVKKMKVEKVKMEEQHEKELVAEIHKQLSVDSFVEKIPEKDATGNPIPPWKRQMLAKKAAEKARREMEEELARQAEEKRLQSIPAWKRQLLQAKRPDDKSNGSLQTAPVIEDKKTQLIEPKTVQIIENTPVKENKENNKPVPVHKETVSTTIDEEPIQIIPWRAQLRKTNSTLNLLE